MSGVPRGQPWGRGRPGKAAAASVPRGIPRRPALRPEFRGGNVLPAAVSLLGRWATLSGRLPPPAAAWLERRGFRPRVRRSAEAAGWPRLPRSRDPRRPHPASRRSSSPHPPGLSSGQKAALPWGGLSPDWVAVKGRGPCQPRASLPLLPGRAGRSPGRPVCWRRHFWVALGTAPCCSLERSCFVGFPLPEVGGGGGSSLAAGLP